MSYLGGSLHDLLGLSGLPTLEDIFNRMDPATVSVFEPLLARLPLLSLLDKIMSTITGSDDEQQRALLDLARLAIAKHDYTCRLHSQLVASVLTTSLSEAEASVAGLPAHDARLAMEMLSLIAELLALNKSHEKGVYAFNIAHFIAERFGLELNRGIVLHQLGMYEMRRRQFASAEVALKEAARIFSRAAPNLARETNVLRALVYKLCLQLETDAPEPDDLESIVASDPRASEAIFLVRASKAIDSDNLVAAEGFIQRLHMGQPQKEASTQTLLVEARLARRKGQFEEADIMLKQANQRPDAARYKDDLTWQFFYLARDLGQFNQSRRLLEQLKGENDSVRVDYQQALVAYNQGDDETAEKLFRSCLARATDDWTRANCIGMLALVSSEGKEVRRFTHEAIGLYHKLGRKLDHAISLSNLAISEIAEGTAWKEAGWPSIMQYQFTRADNLLQHAQEIAEELGAGSYLLGLITHRAQLEFRRERYNVALRHFESAMTALELNYLAISDSKRADLYVSGYTAFHSLAIHCAVLANRPDSALLFSERGKARRFLRDAGEITLSGDSGDSGALAAEGEMLAIIRPLRGRLLQQRALSPEEQQTLYKTEQELKELWHRVSQDPQQLDELAMRVQQPLKTSVLRRLVFSSPGNVEDEDLPEGNVEEEVKELPGGGVMQCSRCFVYNQISSTFCSACEALLPKSGSVNMNLMTGTATEEELKEAYADHLYNRGVKLFSDGQVEESEKLFRQAMEHRTHPDYSFFYGLCRLFSDDPADALASFDEILAQQYAKKYPFWPLPASPSDFRRCIEPLRCNQGENKKALRCLLSAHNDYFERRRCAK